MNLIFAEIELVTIISMISGGIVALLAIGQLYQMSISFPKLFFRVESIEEFKNNQEEVNKEIKSLIFLHKDKFMSEDTDLRDSLKDLTMKIEIMNQSFTSAFEQSNERMKEMNSNITKMIDAHEKRFDKIEEDLKKHNECFIKNNLR